jgi:hypothetical protein
MRCASALVALAALSPGQDFRQRGYFETRTLAYPQTGSNDSGHAVNETVLRWEASYRPAAWITFSGAFDARTDSHRQVARTGNVDTNGQTIQRPALSLRRMSATLHRGKFTVEAGRQFIGWGKTDLLNPTDRFAPKDYLSSVVDTDFLGVAAVRVTYESGGDTIDAVWQPFFTPSRTPLLRQRWTPLPPLAAGIALTDGGAHYPGGSQQGIRWNHIARGYEYSLSFFDGFQSLPSLAAGQGSPVEVVLTRTYPRLRLYGGDFAMPLSWFTVKSEAAYLASPTPGAEEYVLYVLQLERVVGEWSFVGGYAGGVTTRSPANPLQFAADRGIARSFLGRAGLTIDANRSMAVEAAIRAAGSFVRFEYSQATGQHWRTTAGVAWIRGDRQDFLGQYRRNSYASLAIRYSF